MIYRFGAYSVDPERLELSEAGAPVSVQPQVFALMVFLIENRDRVVTKDEIIDTVWDGRIVSDGTLNARINAVRRALGDTGEKQSVIKTLPRRGFRFVAEISGDDRPESGDEAAESSPAAVLRGLPDMPSIAVLPFVNMSGDTEQDYFADGLTEDLITDLSKIAGLFVIARNSSFAYRNINVDVTEIGRDLRVAHVLEGSVRKAGSRVRINAQLIDAATGGHLWAERYDSEMEDIFALQDTITAKIVAALQINLTDGPSRARRTDSVEAYELSLRGRAMFFMFSPATNTECIRLLDKAIEIDPNFSDAWAEQVFPYQSGWSFCWPSYDDGLTVAIEKARRAVELAPSSSFAHSRLGWVQTFLSESENAVASFERALEIDPNNADAYIWFAETLNFAGNPARAIEMGETALRTDPVAPPNCIFHIGHAQFLLGDLKAAAENIGRVIEIVPGFPIARVVMTATLAELGQLDAAKEQIAALKKIHADYNLATFNERYPYANDDHRARVAAGLTAAGLAGADPA